MNERYRVLMGTVVGALIGATATYILFTRHGKELRDRLEPTVDELRQEFERFQRTLEKIGDMASEGMRVVQEFNAARTQSQYPTGETSH